MYLQELAETVMILPYKTLDNRLLGNSDCTMQALISANSCFDQLTTTSNHFVINHYLLNSLYTIAGAGPG